MNQQDRVRVVDSRARILVAARHLFASDGIGAVSIRSVVRESGVNVASVHYHFRSKEGLVRAVFQMASARVNAERKAHLEQAIERSGVERLTVREVLHSLFWPLFRHCEIGKCGQATEEYSILAQLRLDPSSMARRILDEHENDVRTLFDAQFERALPTVPFGDLQLRIRYANAAAWDLLAQPRLLEDLRGASGAYPTPKQVFDPFLNFAVAGMTHDETRCSPVRTGRITSKEKTAAVARRKRATVGSRAKRWRGPKSITRREI